jgi:DDE superfamily endonuclease
MGLGSKAGGSESRFAAYVEAITSVLGHADRAAPCQSYCAGLLLPGDRKSVEPMAAAHAARTRAGGASVAASLRSEGRLVAWRGARGGARPRAARDRAARPDPCADHRRHRHAEERQAFRRCSTAVLWTG